MFGAWEYTGSLLGAPAALPLQSFERPGKAANGGASHRSLRGARRRPPREVDRHDLARLDPHGD